MAATSQNIPLRGKEVVVVVVGGSSRRRKEGVVVGGETGSFHSM